MADKILVSNSGALITKYGTAGAEAVQSAITRLISGDQGRGLQTIYLAVDDAGSMSGVQGNAVTNPADQKQNKDAVDAIYNFYMPQYLVLVGSWDVIPHQNLVNPAPDEDPVVPSDLPYACAAPYSQEVGDFVGPGRVVSRLPDVTAGRDPAYLIHVLDLASNAVTLTHADYAGYLGVSAAVWNQSTALSLGALFGSGAAMQSVPPAGFQWPPNLLARRSHFFNCHGAPLSPQYFGQNGQGYPVAHDAGYITGKLTPGTVASVECCYGAELYDPTNPAVVPIGQMGIANVYLDEGAYGFWGSTTIAYGPASSNAQADLICQYFLQQVLGGASIGRAALAARQTFVKGASALPPSDLKTLAQFILLGDASIHCVPSADAGEQVASKYAITGISPTDSKRLSRIERRQLFAEEGLALQESKAISESSPSETTAELRKKLDEIRVAAKLRDPRVLSYRVAARPERKFLAPAAAMPMAKTPTAFHLLVERSAAAAEMRVVLLRMIEVTETDGEFVRVRELFSR
jgi:hypothetical protein